MVRDCARNMKASLYDRLVVAFSFSILLTMAAAQCDLDSVFVATSGSDASCCGSPSSPCATLSAAVKSVATGGTIFLNEGTFPVQSFGLDFSNRKLTISAVTPGQTIVDCLNGACMRASCEESCTGETLSLSGFTVVNGSTTSVGGCLAVTGHKLTLSDMTFEDCTSKVSGGALDLMNSVSTLTKVTISNSEVYGVLGGGGAISIIGDDVESSKAVLTDVEISSSSAPGSSGGGMFIRQSTVLIVNSKVTGCSSSEYGGGIYSEDSTIKMEETDISLCQSTAGGGYADVNSTVTIIGGTISGCQALAISTSIANVGHGGCLDFHGSDLIMSDTNIIDCSALLDGGGLKLWEVYSTNPISLDGLKFDNCSAANGGGFMIAQVAGPVALSNSVVTNCKGTDAEFGSGGGSYVADVSLSMKKVQFTDNMVPLGSPEEPSQAQGGAIAAYLFSYDQIYTLTVEECIFKRNAAVVGGALFFTGMPVTVTNSNFSYNNAALPSGAGGAIAAYSALTLTGSLIEHSIASSGAGLYIATYEVVAVIGSNFYNNSITIADGGAITVTAGPTSVTVSNTVFTKNTAAGSRGGAIFSSGTLVTVTGCKFVGNTAALKGGAVSVLGSAGSSVCEFSAVGCAFVQSSSPLGGGAIYGGMSASLTINGSKFYDNTSPTGGAILVEEFATLALTGGSCKSNRATTGGGCLSMNDFVQASLDSFSGSDNSGQSEGGFMRVSGSAVARITGGSFVINRAETGGVMWLEQNATVVVKDAEFNGNIGRLQAGSMYATHSSRLSLTNSHLLLNNALLGGAILAEGTSTLTIDQSHFTQNGISALVLQGQAKATITTSQFQDNLAKLESGGAVRVEDQSELSVSGSLFEGNSGEEGGAVKLSSGTAEIIECYLDGNSATRGGAISSSGSATLTINGCNFTENSATGSGGALALLDQSHGSVKLSSFVANSAGEYGAGVYLRRSLRDGESGTRETLAVSQLKFANNTAPASQGVAFLESTYEASLRTECEECESLTALDTVGTLPANFRMMWGGTTYDQGDQAPLQLLGAVNSPVHDLTIKILDSHGSLAVLDNSSMALISPDPRISGLLKGTANQGVISLPPISIQVSPQDSEPFQVNITVMSPSSEFPNIVRKLEFSVCTGGQYFNSTTYSCSPCKIGSWCAAGQPMQVCPDGTFTFLEGAAEVTQCALCSNGDGLDCFGGKAQVAWNHWLDKGSINSTSPNVYQCDITYGCQGYQYSGPENEQCGEGYDENRMCSTCAPGYFLIVQRCEKCGSVFSNVFPLLIILVILAWIGLNMLSNRFISVDVFINELQIVTMIGSFNLNTPMWMTRVLQYYGLVNFDPDLVGPECRLTYNYEQRWAVTMFIPLVGVLAYAALFLYHKLRKQITGGGSEATSSGQTIALRHHVQRRDLKYSSRLIYGITNWLDICYASVIVRCFEAFQSQSLDIKVMGAAPYIEWGSSTHSRLFIAAVVIMLVYVIGVPLGYAAVLYFGKKAMCLEDFTFLQRFGWLTDRFLPEYHWWHMLSVSRRIVFAAIMVFLGLNHPSIALAIALPIQAGRIGLQYANSPYAMTSMDMLNSVLILGEFLFTLGLACWNYLQLHSFANVLFVLSILLIIPPTLTAMAYESVNKWIGYRNAKTVSELHKRESSKKKQLRRSTMTNLSDDEVVRATDVCDWFRPHVVFSLLHSNPPRIKEQKLLLKVRERYEHCRVIGLGDVTWIKHLSKNQLYAVLSQALMGAGAGNMTIARIPVKGGFCTEEGARSWRKNEEEVSDGENADMAWPPPIDRHISWSRRDPDFDPVKEAEEEELKQKEEMVKVGKEGKKRPSRLELSRLGASRMDKDGEEEEETEGEVREGSSLVPPTPGSKQTVYMEAQMNMAELTLTFQRHLSLLVHMESKKAGDSLRTVIRSSAVPHLLAWITSTASNEEDQRLLKDLLEAIRTAAREETGGTSWLAGVIYFFQYSGYGMDTELECQDNPKTPTAHAA